MNKMDTVQFVGGMSISVMPPFFGSGDERRELAVTSIPIPSDGCAEREILHPSLVHAAACSITSKSAFQLTHDALFSHFSILRKAEMVTPLSGELKWDTHLTHLSNRL